jgi:hypothetical protein
MPGFWKHNTRSVCFTPIVDGFGVKYVGEEYVQHLINVLEKFNVVDKDWTGKKYCGINLDWNYN